MNWIGWVTLGIAVVGAALGVINTWTNYRRSTRRIRLKCGYDESQGTKEPRLWCEVINPGGVPITVKSVRAFAVRGAQSKEIPIYGSADAERNLLGSLEPGAFRVTTAKADDEPFFLLVTRVTADTPDGLQFTLSGRRLVRLQSKLRVALGDRAILPPISPQQK